MMADLVQKRQYEAVMVDQAMKGEPAIKPHDPDLAVVDGLGIDGLTRRVEFKLDLRKGAAQVAKNVLKLIRSILA